MHPRFGGPQVGPHRLVLALILTCFLLPRPAFGQETAVIFLVRHAEKEAQPVDDPPLTTAGRLRSEELAKLLADTDLKAIYSTDLTRTRETAAPVGRGSALSIQYYDPGDLAGLAETLQALGGNALVVGHSNTTPVLVELLGGAPGGPIDEAAEYDRLYILTLTAGEVITTLLRYGKAFGQER